MITRFWRGWTTHENAGLYERLVRNTIFPGIRGRDIAGLLDITLLRFERDSEVEFATVIWFTDLDAVRSFAGRNYEPAVIPDGARRLLTRFDDVSLHYETPVPPSMLAAQRQR